MTAPHKAGSVMPTARSTGRRAPRITRHPGSAVAERALAALGASPPSAPGFSTPTYFPVRCVHHRSLLAQHEATSDNEADTWQPSRPDPLTSCRAACMGRQGAR